MKQQKNTPVGDSPRQGSCCTNSVACTWLLDIQVGYRKCVLLDEIPARFDLVSHQRGEDVIGADGVLDLYPQQATGVRIKGRLP